MDAQYPTNRGPLTKAQLAENINDYMDATGIYANQTLDANLNWHKDNTAGTVIIVGGGEELPTLNAEEADGKIIMEALTVRLQDWISIIKSKMRAISPLALIVSSVKKVRSISLRSLL